MIGHKQFEIRATTSVMLSQEDVDDIMCTALEGGITYWCGRVEVLGERVREMASEEISRGGTLRLYDAESDDAWDLNIEKFCNGFRLWMENGGDRYGAVNATRVDTSEIDGDMADMIIQYAIFGEVVFG